jgi:uncharacterized membrane protein
MRTRNWLTVALAASVAVNLALVGFLAGRAGPAPGMTMPPDPSLGAFRVLRDIPESRRDALRPLLREHLRAVRPHLRRLRSAQADIRHALEAEPYDSKALDTALAEFRGALATSQRHSHQALSRLAANMTPGERRLLLDAMAELPRGHRPAPPP